MNIVPAPHAPAELALKCEFWLCLARAFMAPTTPQAQAALRDLLVEDLAELAQQLDYPIAAELAALRAALSAWPGEDALLALYSRLFLIPGRPHPPINMGVYFDGMHWGDSVRQLVECYRACGLDKDGAFRDLPDHVAVQLEFTAWLFAAQAEDVATSLQAGEFVAAFVARWAPMLRRDLAQAERLCSPKHNPWLALAAIVELAARREAETHRSNRVTMEESLIERQRRQYAGRMPSAEEIAALREALAAKGLAAEHLGSPPAPPADMDRPQPMRPPQPPRHVLPWT